MTIRLLCCACFVGYFFIACALGYDFTIDSFNREAQGLDNINTGNSRATFVQNSSFSNLLNLFNAQGYSRPLTGTLIAGASKFGDGELSIINGYDRDAVVVLTYPSMSIHSATYIRASDSFTITGIQDATYNLYFMLGTNWDSGLGKFTKDKSFFQFDRSLPFTTTWTYDGYQYTIYELTLHPVRGGNAVTSIINEEEFPELR